MSSKNTLAVLSVAALLLTPFGASAAGPAKAEDHAVHHPGGAASTPMPAPGAAMQTAPEMSSMRDMRDKMAAARTPDERQALMAEHMKAMQDGMQMMKRMSPMTGMTGMNGMGDMSAMNAMSSNAMTSGKSGKDLKTAKSSKSPKPVTMAMAEDMSRHHEMMMGRMDTMQTMMEMMVQRMPVADAPRR